MYRTINDMHLDLSLSCLQYTQVGTVFRLVGHHTTYACTVHQVM